MFFHKNKPSSLLNFRSKKIKDDLAEVYYQEGKEDFNMSQLDKKPVGRWKIFFSSLFSCLLLIFLFFVIGWGVTHYWRANSPATPATSGNKINSVALSVECPSQVPSGGEVTYRIKYKNIDKATLTQNQILLSYPNGFIFESSSLKPQNNYKNVFSLPDLKPGESGELDIKGILVGKKGETKDLLLSFSYRPTNFSSQFQQLATASVRISSAAAEITLQGPKQVLGGQEAQYAIAVTNKSAEDLKNLRVIVIYPQGFMPEKFTPNPVPNATSSDVPFGEKYSIWQINDLAPQAKQQIKVQGKFSLNLTKVTPLTVKVEVGRNGEYNLIAQNSLNFKPLNKEISLKLILNGAAKNQSASLGQMLNFSLIYKNNGTKDLKNVSIRAFLKAKQGDQPVDLLDFSSLKDPHHGYLENGEILWTDNNILNLSSFSAGEEGQINFSVPIKKSLKDISLFQAGNGDLTVDCWAVLKAQGFASSTASSTSLVITSNKIVVHINTAVKLKAEARYFNDDNMAVGSGPVPPQVGKTTTYRVYWKISNSLHPINQVEVSGQLPAYVQWGGKALASVGNITYDPQTRKVIWNVGNLLPGAKDIQASFALKLTPTEKQVNKVLVLLNNINLTALDGKTGENIQTFQKPLTTDLESDPIMSGKGLVAPSSSSTEAEE